MRFLKPVKKSPILRRVKSAFDRASGADILRREMEELRQNNIALSQSISSTESRLIEANRALEGKTGISVGWGFQSKDFSQAAIGKMQALAHQAYHGHPLAKKAVKTKRAFVCQEGFKLEATYDGPGRDGMEPEEIRARVQDFLDAHWDINWKDRLERRVDSKLIYGETAFWLPPANQMSGQSQAGMIDRDRIMELLPDPLNAERAGCLKLDQPLKFWVDGKWQMRQEIPIVRYCWRDLEYKGEILYWGSNMLDTMYRGVSDFCAVLDYLEMFDDLVWTEGERVKMMRSLLFHWIEKGTEQKALDKKQAELSASPPKPGTFFCTNESVEIKEIVPGINTAPSLEFIKFIFGLASGCLDLPEHYYYQADTVNKASGQEMKAPVFAAVREEKSGLSRVMYTQNAYALQKASKVENSPVYGLTTDEMAFEVKSRDPERDSADVIGQHLLALSQAMVVIKAEGWMTDEQIGSIIRTEAGSLGLGEIDAPEPEDDDADQAISDALNSLERRRTIEGQEKVFPLAPNGERDWAVKKPA